MHLREKSWIERTDTGGFAITAAGVDEIEKEGLILDKDRLITQSAGITEEPEIIKLITEESSETDNRYESAITKLKGMIASHPKNLLAWLGLAYLHIKSGQNDEATEAIKEIYKIDSNFSIDDFLSTRKFKNQDISDILTTHLKNITPS